MKISSILWIFALLLSCNSGSESTAVVAKEKTSSLPSLPADGPASVAIGNGVVQRDVKRLGINLCQYSNYGTGQILKNLLARNPGFEGWEYRSIVEVGEGRSDGFSDVAPPGGWQDGFWDKAEFEVIWGQAKGRRGSVEKFQRGQAGNSYRCAGSGPSFAKGDQVVLRQRHRDAATGGWWPQTSGGAKYSSGEQRPNSSGEQSLRMDCSAGGSLRLHGYFDPPAGEGAGVNPLVGRYALRFWARGLSPGTSLGVRMARLLNPHREYLRQTLALSGDWHAYEFIFEANDDAQQAVVDLEFQLDRGSLLLDDVALSAVADHEPTIFSDAVVGALRKLRPGILRGWAGQLGDSFDNMLSDSFSRRMSGYSRWGQDPKVIGYGLHSFLELCEALDTEAWYVLPISLSAEERSQLIEYLGGAADTPMGQRRAALGHARPWTDTLRAVHLELGNEAWNGIFKGGCLERPEVYGQVGEQFFGELRRAPDFNPNKIKLVLGGQAVFVERNQTIVKQSTQHNAFAIAPYLLHKLDAPVAVNEPLVRLYAEIDGLAQAGYLRQNLKMLGEAPKPVELAVYEVNLHTTDGSADEATVNQLVTSAGAGVAVGAHMLQMVGMGIRDQCFYTLNQLDFQRPDKKNVRLWGALRDLRVDGRKRPIYIVLELLNRALEGDMLEVAYGGHIEKLSLGQLQVVRPVSVACFRKGKTCHLIAINYNPDRVQELQLRLPFVNKGPIQHSWLRFVDPMDDNETQVMVDLAEEGMDALPDTLRLNPAGFHLWRFSIE